MVEFDPKFIKVFAQGLYAQAKSVTAAHFFIGMLLGLLVFGGVSRMLLGDYDFLILAIGVLVGSIMGIGSGKYKALELQLKAHLALCLAQIEENSRRE